MRVVRSATIALSVVVGALLVFQIPGASSMASAESLETLPDPVIEMVLDGWKAANVTSDESEGIWIDTCELDEDDCCRDPPPMEIVLVTGEVTVCSRQVDESPGENLTADVVWFDDSLTDAEGTEYLESAGTITVTGRVVYENVITSISADLPASPHPYTTSFDRWLYGNPGTTSVWIFFPKIEVEYPNDDLNIYDQNGVLRWYTQQTLYENLWVNIPGNAARISLVIDNSIYKWGYEVTKFSMDSDRLIGVPGAPVEIWDWDWWGSEKLTTVTTDSQGYFSSGEISNDDDEGGTQDIFVKAISNSDKARVMEEGGGDYYFATDRIDNVPDGTLDLGNLRSSDPDNPGWIVYSALMDCWNTFKYGGPSHTVPQLKAVWDPGHDASYWLGCSSTSHYDIEGLRTGEIHLDSPDGERPDVILHECAHHIMFREYDNWLPGAVEEHYYTGNIPEGPAWSEGWAQFVPHAVGMYTGKGDRYRDLGGGYNNIFYDLETSARTDNGQYPGDGSGWIGGDTQEATISYAMYDIYDSATDGLDTWTGGLSRIWNVLDDRRTTDFSDYFDCFRDHYYSTTSYITYCTNAIKQGSRGTINYDPVMFYDDFTDGNIDDWVKVTSGGTVTVDSSLGNVSTPCMKIYKGGTGAAEASSKHMFPTQGGDFVVEAKVMTPDPGGYLYLWVMKGCEHGIYVGLKSDAIEYFDTGWHSIGATCVANTWYLMTFDIRAASGYYDIYVDGLLKKSNAKFYGGATGQKYLDTVKFQAGYYGQTYKALYVDDVVVRGGKILFLDQFRDNLDDWMKVSSGGPVTWDLTKGSCAKPSISLYKQQTSGGTSAKHYFSSKSDGRVFLEARAMVSTTASWKLCYVDLFSGGYIESYLVLRDGYIMYYSGTTWYTTAFSYSANTWFKIGIDLDLESGKYDLYGNGAKLASYIPMYSGTGSIDNVYLQAGCYNDLYGVTLWVDDITVTYR